MLPSGQLSPSLLALARLSKPTASSIAVADRAMQENRYQLFSKLEDIVFPGGVIDWDIVLPQSQNTYHLYLHSLTFIDYACGAFIKTSDAAYLDFAGRNLVQWLDYADHHPYNPKGKSSGNSHLWYDHTVSSRVRLMIHYYCLAIGVDRLDPALRQRIVEALLQHAVFLIDPRQYRKFNHGLMMDRALLVLAQFMHEAEPQHAAQWTQTAVTRLREGLERDFTEEMVHRENSAGYHLWALDFFRSLIEPLAGLDADFMQALRDRIGLAEAFFCNLILPNGYLAAIGDTLTLPRKETPRLESALYPQAGIVIFAQRDPADLSRSTWIHFKSGYATHTHKHADDLAFALHAGGYPVFIDPGMMSYAATPSSRAFTTAMAHNTLVVDDASYPIQQRVLTAGDFSNLPVAGLSEPLTIAPAYSTAGGFNNAYDGVSLARRVMFLPPGLLILHDRFLSTQGDCKISQLFHVAPQLRIARSGRRGALLLPREAEGTFNVRIRQLVVPQEMELERACGDTERDRGFYTEKFDTRLPLQELAFVRHGVQGDLITAIAWEMDEAEMDRRLEQALEIHATQLHINPRPGMRLEFARDYQDATN